MSDNKQAERYTVFLKNDHRDSFRMGELAEIVGVEFVIPNGQEGRFCYLVRFADGTEDLMPIKENEHDLLSGKDVGKVYVVGGGGFGSERRAGRYK